MGRKGTSTCMEPIHALREEYVRSVMFVTELWRAYMVEGE